MAIYIITNKEVTYILHATTANLYTTRDLKLRFEKKKSRDIILEGPSLYFIHY